MDKNMTIGIIESATVELKSLLRIAQKDLDSKNNQEELQDIDFCLSKMQDHVYKLNDLFENGDFEKL